MNVGDKIGSTKDIVLYQQEISRELGGKAHEEGMIYILLGLHLPLRELILVVIHSGVGIRWGMDQ